MSDDNFDDGLVHRHRWASHELARPLSRRRLAETATQEDEQFDEGLVHGHSWAVNQPTR
ncbi:MAG: hypothetical protein JOY71_20900 [Acetobacteraceae bacterium]|nr:hypothetical protein [Acetobacteraceae bacterium]MBV8524548.1 hypothetical protein [Acetobacteraceae bacterium]MBV8592098.1 hypothetical protein [Acetobacteraceae bacterium]